MAEITTPFIFKPTGDENIDTILHEIQSMYTHKSITTLPNTQGETNIHIERIYNLGKQNGLGKGFVLYNVLSKEECEFYVNETERIGYGELEEKYALAYRYLFIDLGGVDVGQG